MKDLSILIPSRNERFLKNTIEDILKNIEADTEIIAVLDGAWTDPPIPQHERVDIIYVPKSIGQRAAANLACRFSSGKYVMKIDAHCAFDKGFDRKMLEVFKKTGDNVTMVPTMRNLWAFDWKCTKCGKKWYQGPTPTSCQETNFKHSGKPCDSAEFIRKMMWVGKERPQSNSYCFDAEPHFQYFNEYTKRPEYKKDLEETGFTETMSLQGSCFMLTKEKYWELDICSETFGSWGNQGIEVAVKTWLSGGKVLVNHKTWYAHMFRTQGGDFGFPYPLSGKEVASTKKEVRNLFFNNQWEKQIYPLSWLIEKFWPVKGWTEEDLRKLKTNKFKFKDLDSKARPVESEPVEEKESKPDEIATPPPDQIEPEADKKKQERQTEVQLTLDQIGLGQKESYAYIAARTNVTKGRKKKIFKEVTIIGHGWVGKSVHRLFPDAYIYDPPKGGKQRANQGSIAFICVPTPSLDEGNLDTSIVEECVAWCQCPLIIIRSTVNPGTCDYLSSKYKKRIIMQPEYLGETPEHPLFDEKNIPFLIIGGNPEDRRTLIDLYTKVYSANVKIRQVTAYEAEIIKLTENRAIAFKVAQCQELYDVCEGGGIDYYTIRDAVYGDDPRFNLWWTFVFPDKRGFDSKCIPKDVYAWCAWAESLGYNPEITRNLLESNKKWISQKPQAQNDSESPRTNGEIMRQNQIETEEKFDNLQPKL